MAKKTRARRPPPITLFVGRVVHYAAADRCWPAIVTGTYWSSRQKAPAPFVSLCAFDPTGGVFFRREVNHDAERKPGTWHWPEHE